MATTIYPAAGCKFYIGSAVNFYGTVDADDFNGQAWTQVKPYLTMGETGDNYNLISVDAIDEDRTLKIKGTANAPERTDTFLLDAEDPGQIAMIAASNSRSNFAFRIDLNDAEGGGQPSKRYFVGLVMSARESGGGANDARNFMSTIAVNSNVVRVAAT